MFTDATAVLLSFFITALFVLVLRPVAESIRLVDVPGGRKRHDMDVPIIGGIAMCLGMLFGFTFMAEGGQWIPIQTALVLLVVVGAIDDRFDLPANVRLVAQACAVLMVMYGSDIAVSNLGSPLFFDVPLGFLSAPFSLLFMVAVINAFNLIDGLDGLAGGLAFLALVAMAVLGFGTDVFSMAIVLAAVVAAFLLFNLPLGFNRAARCFMGDAGSTFLGLAVATLGIVLSQGAAPVVSPVTILWIIAIPVFDLVCSFGRRLIAGKSPFVADHDHLHHILNADGTTRRGAALLVLLGMAAGCAGIGIAGHMLSVPEGHMMLLWIAAGAAFCQAARRPEPLIRLIRAPEQVVAQRKPQAVPESNQ